MANWQYKINIKPIHDTYREIEDLEVLKASMAKECRLLAGRVRLAPDNIILQDLADKFECVDDSNEYDEVLYELYDWGDYQHKCWINSI